MACAVEGVEVVLQPHCARREKSSENILCGRGRKREGVGPSARVRVASAPLGRRRPGACAYDVGDVTLTEWVTMRGRAIMPLTKQSRMECLGLTEVFSDGCL